jgi:hypothetical protein
MTINIARLEKNDFNKTLLEFLSSRKKYAPMKEKIKTKIIIKIRLSIIGYHTTRRYYNNLLDCRKALLRYSRQLFFHKFLRNIHQNPLFHYYLNQGLRSKSFSY